MSVPKLFLDLNIASVLIFMVGGLCLLPAFNIVPGYPAIVVLLMFSLTLHVFIMSYSDNGILSSMWILGLLIFCYVAAMGIFSRNYAVVGRFSQYLLIANFCQLAVIESSWQNKISFKRLVDIFCFFNIFTCFTTLMQLAVDPAAARMVAESSDLQKLNIGGYGFVYMQLVMLLVWSDRMVEAKSKFWRLTDYAGFYLSLLLLLTANYLIAASLSIFVVVYLFFFRHNVFLFSQRWIRGLILTIAFSLFVYFAVLIDIQDLYLSVKIVDIFFSIFSSGESVYLSERLFKYSTSINGALMYPVLGVLGNGEDVFNWSLVGRHSYILDNFALMGVPGGILSLIYLLSPIFIFCRAKLGIYCTHAPIAAFLMFSICALNILSVELILAFYFVGVFVGTSDSSDWVLESVHSKQSQVVKVGSGVAS